MLYRSRADFASTIRRADHVSPGRRAGRFSRQKARIRFPLVTSRRQFMRRARHLIDACTRAIKINPTSLRSFTNARLVVATCTPRLGPRADRSPAIHRRRVVRGAPRASRDRARRPRGVGATWKINRGFSVVVESAEGDVEGEESAEGESVEKLGGAAQNLCRKFELERHLGRLAGGVR